MLCDYVVGRDSKGNKRRFTLPAAANYPAQGRHSLFRIVHSGTCQIMREAEAGNIPYAEVLAVMTENTRQLADFLHDGADSFAFQIKYQTKIEHAPKAA